MDFELSTLQDLDNFFFYGTGENDIAMEIESDLVSGLMQPKRRLFYDRSEGCGLVEKENQPNTLLFTILTKYDIVNWIGKRNNSVSDGSDGSTDRRILISQDSISFVQDGGNVDIEVNYIPLYNFKKPSKVSIPIGG